MSPKVNLPQGPQAMNESDHIVNSRLSGQSFHSKLCYQIIVMDVRVYECAISNESLYMTKLYTQVIKLCLLYHCLINHYLHIVIRSILPLITFSVVFNL